MANSPFSPLAHPQPHQSQNLSLLLNIPQELRDMIFSFLLVSDHALRTPTLSYQHHIDTEILRTNRQVYTEACTMLLNENTFLFERHEDSHMAIFRESTLLQARKIKAQIIFNGWSSIPSFCRFLDSRNTTPLRSLHINLVIRFPMWLPCYAGEIEDLEHVKVRDEVVLTFDLVSDESLRNGRSLNRFDPSEQRVKDFRELLDQIGRKMLSEEDEEQEESLVKRFDRKRRLYS